MSRNLNGYLYSASKAVLLIHSAQAVYHREVCLKYHIELTDEEKALVETIDLRTVHQHHSEGYAAHEANKQPILALLKSLSERHAIPEERLNYWTDPAYNTGRLKTSHKGVFERNGRTDQEIYTHPHFISYLRYFLFGPDLPVSVIGKFEERVGNPSWVTSSDVAPIGKFARALAREYQISRNHASEEFFKLCLDIGLGLDTAGSVRRSVMQLR